MAEPKEPGSHLLNTIESQPRELARLLDDDAAERASQRLRDASRIFLVGTGTSFHGALVGQYLFRSAGREAWAVRAFEFSKYPPAFREGDGLVLLSHRGSKRFSRAALDLFRDLGQRWVAITGEGSALEGDGVVKTVAQEISPVHTASHTGAMVRLAQLASALGPAPWRAQLGEIPSAVGEASLLRADVAEAVGRIDFKATTHYAGTGPALATALEGALKLREAAFVATEGHELESLLHGPLVSLQAEQTAIVVAQPGPSLERTAEVMAALSEIKCGVLAVGPEAEKFGAPTSLVTPALEEVLAPIVNVIPLQWLAYEASQRLAVDADSFRRDEPLYAAAQAKFTL